MTLPNGISGDYYLLVKSDANDTIEEAAFEDNNVLPSNLIAVSLAPYADLTVTTVTSPTRLIGDPVDLAVIIVPAKSVLTQLEECGQCGIHDVMSARALGAQNGLVIA